MRSRGAQRVTLVAASLALSIFLLGQNLAAEWWVIDDHEIMWFLGAAPRLSLGEIVPKLMQTEIGSGSSLARFRPVYYLIRLLETWTWGRNPGLWYGFRLLSFAAFLMAVWKVTSTRIGFVAAALLTAYTASFGYWSDVFGRLGPSEAYAALGLATCIIGVDVVGRAPEAARGWLLLMVGTIVAAGSKENLVLLGIVSAGELAFWSLKRRARLAAWVCVAVSLGWCGWIIWVVLGRAAQGGGDVYGNSISLTNRLGAIVQAATQPAIAPVYLFLSAALALWLLLRRSNARLGGRALTAFAVSVLVLGLYLSQAAFYNGAWPTGTRYDFPGMLCWPILLFTGMWFLKGAAEYSSATGLRPNLAEIVAILVGLIAVAVHAGGFGEIRTASAVNVGRTVRFTGVIEEISDLTSQHPGHPVLIQSDNPWDYEPLWSYPRFLTAYGVRNEMFLLWTPTGRPSSNFLESLSASLADYSRLGLPGEYLPLTQMKTPTNECILIVLSGTPGRACQIQVDGDWREF